MKTLIEVLTIFNFTANIVFIIGAFYVWRECRKPDEPFRAMEDR